MKPNAKRHNPSPEHIRALCDATGLSMYKLADRLGVTRAVLYKWTTGKSECPYIAQFALECLKRKSAQSGATSQAYVNTSKSDLQ